jgi:hypothetical protein
MTDHPVKVPPELVQQWLSEPHKDGTAQHIANRSAQWGADQELEACREWLNRCGFYQTSNHLRATRRPKPPTLAEQALATLPEDAGKYDFTAITTPQLSVIRAALTRLAELEAQ